MTLVIGLSATPTRTKRTEDLGDKFTHLVQTPPVHELMEMGRLVGSMTYWGFSAGGSISVEGVHTQMGDFKADELEVASDKPELLNHAVAQWQRLADGLRTLAYCVSIKHAENMAHAFNANGIPAAVVTGGTKRDERQEIYRKLAEREILLICSVNVLSIGFDLPCAEALLCARPTKSIAVWLQQLGRGARAHPGKATCIVLDQAGNAMRHGPLEAERDWALQLGKAKGPGGGGFEMKQCVKCDHLMLPQLHICPLCGAEQPIKEKVLRTDDLVELRFDKAETKRMKQLHRWVAKAYRQGYLHGWVLRMWEQKFTTHGHPPAEMWHGAIYGPNPTPENAMVMATHWGKICRKKNRSWPIALTAITREFEPTFMETLDVAELRLAWLSGYAQAPN